VITSTDAQGVASNSRGSAVRTGGLLRRIPSQSQEAAASYVNEFAAQLSAETVAVIDAITRLPGLPGSPPSTARDPCPKADTREDPALCSPVPVCWCVVGSAPNRCSARGSDRRDEDDYMLQ
jgi:hypothetical protein